MKNYTELFFNDSTFIICLRNNLYWVLVSLGLIPLAFMLAVLIDEFKRAADYSRTLIFTASTLSLVVVGLMFGFVYNANKIEPRGLTTCGEAQSLLQAHESKYIIMFQLFRLKLICRVILSNYNSKR